MNNLLRPIYRLIVNWNNPHYSKLIFKFASKYVDFCYGDNNFDRNTNGEHHVLKCLMPKVKVVFDVGANTGDYASNILSLNKNVKIHSFEPDKKAFDVLSKKGIFKANNVAVGDKKGTIDFYLDNGKTVLNSVIDLPRDEKGSTKVSVPIITIDEYAKENKIDHIDFLKIDVEGYEYSVLKGTEGLLSKKSIDVIQFEFSGATAYAKVFLRDFIDLLSKYGYNLYRVKPLSIERINYRPDQERFTLTNYIALRDGFSVNIKITDSTYLQ